VAASAFLVTNTSAATAALAWMFCEWIVTGKPTVLGIASGVVAGLVAITPAAGFVNLPASLVIGLVPVAGLLFRCRSSSTRSVTTILWTPSACTACAASGVPWPRAFRQPRPSPRRPGLFYGNPGQLWIQFVSIIATAPFTAVGHADCHLYHQGRHRRPAG
jgi:Amt family ammonium transporter